ncbi:MAG: hypothetical protein IPM29_29920 [Planctomycetes bacterium]|nr:hypothetical protein [Planctomycetota bacterium]
MEKISIECSGCGTVVKAPASMAGRTGKCPKCQAPLRLPAAAEQPGDPPKPAAAPTPAGSEPAPPESGEPAAHPRRPSRAGGRQRTRVNAADRRERLRAEPKTENMPLVLGAAAGGALLGALIWAGIMYATHHEIGWLAIGVGALTGGAAFLAGGRGTPIAILTAVLATVGILGGKFLGYQLLTSQELTDEIAEQCTEEGYQTLLADARLFSELPDQGDDQSVRSFMHERGHTRAPSPDRISDLELASFRRFTAPYLRDVAKTPPGLDGWRAHVRAVFEAYPDEEATPWDRMTQDFDPKDILFFAIGIAAAWGVVMSRTRREHTDELRARREARGRG